MIADKIRLATPEEIQEIEATSDLGPGCTVMTFENSNGPSDLAVYRTVPELDPLHHRSSARRKAAFIWGVETALRMQGVPFYYFNVAADDTDWQAVVTEWGAQCVSRVPELRYKRVL